MRFGGMAGVDIALPAAGEVALIQFPYAEIQITKWRPGLVISTLAFHEKHYQAWVLMITSTELSWPDDIQIEDWKSAGLIGTSFVRMKMNTIDCRTFGRTIGKVSGKLLARVRAQCADIIGA